MTNRYDWLLKKNLRSVDNLRLWGQNPRLDPENSYTTTMDFAEEMIATTSDRDSFIELAKSITSKGFIPADPIVVWQDENNQKFYIAEGNRRVLALKLLRNPSKSPKSIRAAFIRLSASIKKEDFEKIYVSIAPKFEDAEWYISQRNSISSLQRKWASEMQRRWVVGLYDKYHGNIEIIKNKIEISEAELQGIIRLLKIKEYVKDIESELSKEEFMKANSINFPFTTIERFFGFKDVRDLWGIEYDENEVKIANKESFLIAFAELIKRILITKGEPNRIDSRTMQTVEDVKNILASLPTVCKVKEDSDEEGEGREEPGDDGGSEGQSERDSTKDEEETEEEKREQQKKDPYRSRLICNFYTLDTDSHKLSSLFDELKAIPFKYSNCISASLRVFLDLAVMKYIETEQLKSGLEKNYKSKSTEIQLKKKLEFIKENIKDSRAVKIIDKLLNPKNDYSLDVLNCYIHSDDTHYSSQHFLNGFWDFLFPLFQKLLVIKEEII
jgi:hypothetical protein